MYKKVPLRLKKRIVRRQTNLPDLPPEVLERIVAYNMPTSRLSTAELNKARGRARSSVAAVSRSTREKMGRTAQLPVSTLRDLPPDILRLVGKCLSKQDYLSFRSTSKHTRKALLLPNELKFERAVSDPTTQDVEYLKKRTNRGWKEGFHVGPFIGFIDIPQKVGQQILKQKGYRRVSTNPYADREYHTWIRR